MQGLPLSASRPSALTEPCPASDAEPPLQCPVLLPILRRTPDEQRANENERYEQHEEHDHNEDDIHTVVLPEAPRFYVGVECPATDPQAPNVNRRYRSAPNLQPACPA
jgi:hypothetical protein